MGAHARAPLARRSQLVRDVRQPARDARVRLLTEAKDWKRLVDELALLQEHAVDAHVGHVTELEPLFKGEYVLRMRSGERITTGRSFREPVRRAAYLRVCFPPCRSVTRKTRSAENGLTPDATNSSKTNARPRTVGQRARNLA